ncbi:SMI1/KNR4 family protein [Lentzea sp. NEAU-D13]|uniref:SMI1/KNR4 family protein n=1 Tax=Lentzea alba TaxID=2714351 RepID=A0A7C9VV10_9PSEU|nr:SMI1/KNR4 family protein [Lentzea alba]NGY63772.1 SMI1/KNR4 family protein [Lentzea alba]
MTFDVAGSVARAMHDRSAAWRFIEGFLAAWTEPIGPEDGWTRRELAEAEDRLGVGLPEALKEALALFGTRPEVTSNHDRLLAPAELWLDGDVLVFRSDQWIEAWGVRLAGADPEVLVRHDSRDKHQYPWNPWMPRFSLACVELVLSMAVFGDGGETADRERKDADLPLLDEHFTLLPLNSPLSRWFVSDDVIIREDDRAWLWACARTPEAFEQLVERFPGAWER